MVKEIYQEAIRYIKDNNVKIEDCFSENIDLSSFKSTNQLLFSEEDKNKYCRIILLNILFKEDSKEILNYLIKVNSKNKDVLFVLFNLIKRICSKMDLRDSEQLEIIAKCKEYWCYKFLRGCLVQIFTMLSSSKFYFEILPLDFIVRYNLWTKETFYSSRFEMNDIDLGDTISGSGEITEKFNISLVVKFLKSINFMNYKYLRKTMLLLDLEMFKFLPSRYTEMGLANLRSVINEYKGQKNGRKDLKNYLSSILPINIPLLGGSEDSNWMIYSSSIIRREFLESITSYDKVFNFIMFSQLNDDEEMIDLIYRKTYSLFVGLYDNQKKDLSILINDACRSIFPYRRLLGLRLSECFCYNNLSYKDKINLLFDNSHIVRKYSKVFLNELDYEDFEAIIKRDGFKDIDSIKEYINMKSLDFRNITDLSHEKIANFLNGNYSIQIDKSLSLIVHFDCISKGDIERLKAIVVKPYNVVHNRNKILKEICHFYYKIADRKSLIEVLLSSDDLGVILIIDKYLSSLQVEYSEKEIQEMVESLRFNDKRIRRSAGLGVLFKSLSPLGRKLSLQILLNNITAHLDCDQITCHKNPQECKLYCENLLYHSYSIILSIIQDEVLSLDILKICFSGLRSSMWIVRNNSLQLFRIIYDKVECIELNQELRNYVRDLLKTELINVKEITKSDFNDLIFCLGLVFKKYETLDIVENYLFEEIRNQGGVFGELSVDFNTTERSLRYVLSVKDEDISSHSESFWLSFAETYTTMVKMLLILVSEDLDARNNLIDTKFKSLNCSVEKIILEIIKNLSSKKLLTKFLDDIKKLNGLNYDLNYLVFLSTHV